MTSPACAIHAFGAQEPNDDEEKELTGDLNPPTLLFQPSFDQSPATAAIPLPSSLKKTLRGQIVDESAIDTLSFISFSKEDLAKKELQVKDKKLFLGDESTVKLDSSIRFPFIYVMMPDHKIYITKPIDGKIFHSSLTQGNEPLAAGEIVIKYGYIFLINEKSGHFCPKNRAGLVVEDLQSQGYQFPQNFILQLSRFEETPPEARSQTPSAAERAETLSALLANPAERRSSTSPSARNFQILSPSLAFPKRRSLLSPLSAGATPRSPASPHNPMPRSYSTSSFQDPIEERQGAPMAPPLSLARDRKPLTASPLAKTKGQPHSPPADAPITPLSWEDKPSEEA
jgi:hypothetical protein